MPDTQELRRLVLSCLLLGFTGPVPPSWLLRGLADGLGGVVLFGSNLPDGSDPQRLVETLRTAAGRDIVIALDEEGGDVTRLDTTRGSTSPGAAALGHLDDPDVTENAYRAIGARCAAVGVTLDLAPVADVNVDPNNPVIGVRAFAADGNTAARHVAAAVRGIQSAGVAACLKHFPGHGATRADSHHEIATVQRSRTELDTVDLVPFRAGISAGARAVMTGHLLVPALDPSAIATFSAPITSSLLRAELGFAGAVVTDALEMQAVAATVGMVEGFVRAQGAGADAIETGALDYPHLLDEIPAAVERAVDEGRIDTARLESAARRTAGLAARPVGIPAAEMSEFEGCLEIVGELPPLRAPLVIECRPPGGMASGELPWSLGDPLAALLPGTDVVRTEGPLPLDERRDLVLVVRDPQRVTWQQPMVAAAARHPRAVLVDCGWPGRWPGIATVRTRGIAPGLLHAAAHTLAAGGSR